MAELRSLKEMLDGCDWKQTPKTECEALMLTHERNFRPATWGCSFQGTSWKFSETQEDPPHGSWVHPSLKQTAPGCTLKENSFLFPSKRTVVFSLWYAQAWYLIGYLRNSFAEWSSMSAFGDVFGNSINLNDFIHSFVHSWVHLFPSENKPGLYKRKEWKLSRFET